MQVTNGKGLPENAFTELKPGEKYEPLVSADLKIPEVTFRSVFWGLLFAIIFGAGAAFLALKIAQGLEAAIPVAIISVGLAFLYKRKSTIIENVMIQSIGSTGSIMAATIVFVAPALFILGLDEYATFLSIAFAGIVGGFIGVVYLIPFRRHYVVEMHGKYPFPEATAGAEILVVGEKGGKQAKVLLFSALIGGAYDFLSMFLGAWREVFTTKLIPALSFFTDKLKMVFDLNTGAAIIGMGFIIGVRYCMLLASASFLSFFVFVPLIAYFGANMVAPTGQLIGDMSAGEIFSSYVRFIGIGTIATAAILNVLKSLNIMKKAIKEGLHELFHGRHKEGSRPRTDKDMNMAIIVLLMFAIFVALFVFFRWSLFGGVGNANMVSLVSLVIVALVSFVFTTVAIWCIAVTARNPISGMTIVTLVVASLAFLSLGIVGKPGMAAVLIIGTMVSSALGTSGQFISDLKIGYWLGSTPKNQQRWKFIGIFISALAITAVVIILNKVYGFTPDRPNALPAPQANAMAAVMQMVMGDGQAPWLMYAIGAIIAVLFEMMKIPTLAIGLGMYLPMHLNMTLLVGGLLNYFISNTSKSGEINKERATKGTLVASGLIAGGAVMGVIGAILLYIQQSTGKVFLPNFNLQGTFGNYLSIIMLAVLIMYILFDSMRVKKE